LNVSTQCNFIEIAKVVNIDINLEVNFTKKILEGFVIHTVEKVNPSATQVVMNLAKVISIDPVYLGQKKI